MKEKTLRETLRHFLGYIEMGEGATLKFWQDDATKSFHAYRGNKEICWSDKGFDDLLNQLILIASDEAEEERRVLAERFPYEHKP